MIKVRFTNADNISEHKIVEFYLHDTNGIVSIQYKLLYDKLIKMMKEQSYIPTSINYSGVTYDFLAYAIQYKKANNIHRIALITVSRIASVFIEHQLMGNEHDGI